MILYQNGDTIFAGKNKIQEKYTMSGKNNPKNTKNNKKEDGKFKSKNIKHDPNAESARAVFGLNKPNEIISVRPKNEK